MVLALLNSPLVEYTLKLVNPTVNFQVGDLARLPIPTQTSAVLDGLVERAIALAREDSVESETTYDFVAPPAWPNGGADVAARRAELAAIEQEIDEEVYRLYGIAGEDRAAIEAELSVVSSSLSVEDDDEQPTTDNEQLTTDNEQLTTDQLARQWISYALGVALGRFRPSGGGPPPPRPPSPTRGEGGDGGKHPSPLVGEGQRVGGNPVDLVARQHLTPPPPRPPSPTRGEGGDGDHPADLVAHKHPSPRVGEGQGVGGKLPSPRVGEGQGVGGNIGRGRFTPEVAAQLRGLADEDGLGMIESGHPDDLGARVERVLELMVGEEEAHRLIAVATGGKPLVSYLIGDFYKEHVRQYRKRPVYWLLQSPRKTFSILLFHERLTGDSLPLILGNRYLQGRVNALRGRLGEFQGQVAAAAPGRARKAVERERDEVAERLTDAEEFARLIRAVIERPNERGEIAGWRPAIDDGVLINLAPLYTLMPAWAVEPKKCWQALERGDYDWSHTAMRYCDQR
ncbi:hypothetical protein EYB53_025225 [Candidatus Chloroploca sp. M-50]|uniref:Uncharacterized protein n=1 Tax=Candidatus Chloroploca mongolica TaxID=2528176 RepID=A0ABS4DHX3_9CHLR|nr:hypothetical protein [Candidatus Chloroploca mongolica]MBP1469035.1 hypothetical protein [Candidatus Chloroploca mongolica]